MTDMKTGRERLLQAFRVLYTGHAVFTVPAPAQTSVVKADKQEKTEDPSKKLKSSSKYPVSQIHAGSNVNNKK